MNILKKYQYLIEILILFIVSLTPLIWFTPNHMVLGLDSGYPIDFIARFQERLFTWFEPYNFGVDMTGAMGQIPLFGLLAFVKFIGFSIYSVQKVTFVFWFFAMVLSMYTFVFYLFPKAKFWIIRIVAVFIYVFNFHLLSFWIQGAQPTLSSYVFLPILSLLLFKFFKKEISAFKAAILINIGYFFFNAGGVFGIPLLGSSIITGLSIFIFYFLILFKEEKMQLLKRIIFFGFYLLVFSLFFNAYFLLPFLNSFGEQFASHAASTNQGIESAINWNKYISRYDSYLNLFRLQGDNSWYDNPYLYSQTFLNNRFLIFASFLFPIFAYISIFLVKEKKEKILVSLLMLISLIAVLFSAGAHPPFGFLYTLAMKHIPGFAAFKSGYYKFIPALYFSFSILIGISIFYISEKLKKYKHLFGFLVLIAILIYHYPFFDQARLFNYDYPFTTMVKPPDYIFDYMKFEKSLSKDSRILTLPPYSNSTQSKAYKWGYISASPLFAQITKKSFVYNNAGLSSSERILVDNLYQSIRENNFGKFTYFAKLLNIGYVIITSDIANNYESASTEDPMLYKEIVDKNSDLFTKVWSEGPWDIYGINLDVVPRKISVLDNLLLYSNFDYAKRIVTVGNIQFISESQFSEGIDKTILNKLPISSKLTIMPCASCINYKPELETYYSRVIPGSLFYPLKLFIEEYNFSKKTTIDEKLDSYLGLSMKRVAEINQQAGKSNPTLNTYDWNNSLNLLMSYWSKIYDYIASLAIDNKRSFELLNKIHRYAESEVAIISNSYDGMFKKNEILKIKLENILWAIRKADPLAYNILLQYNLGNKFSYGITPLASNSGAIKLDLSSLPRDFSDKSILPSSYEIDKELFSFPNKDEQGDPIISNVKGDSRNLILFFNNIQNLLTDYKDTTLNFPTFTRNCLYSSVKDYKWENTYSVRGKVGKINGDAYFYIKKDRDQMVTSNSSRKYSDFFNPDYSLTINAIKGETLKYQFSGNPNDKGVSLYLCTDLNDNPRDAFVDLSVEQIIQPNIYSLENYSLGKTQMPSVKYKEINPTGYIIQINNASDQYILSFLERFSSSWKARYTDDGREIGNHFIINGYANGWLIDRKGNYDIEIYFASQSIFEKGIFITTSSVVVLLLFFILSKVVGLYKNYDNKRRTS